MSCKEKREPTERELEEQLLRHIAGVHAALEQLLRRKWKTEGIEGRIAKKIEPGSPAPPATPTS